LDIERIENYPNNRGWQVWRMYCLYLLLIVELAVAIASPFLQNLFPPISTEIAQGIRLVDLSVGLITVVPLSTVGFLNVFPLIPAGFSGFLSNKRILDGLRRLGKATRMPGIIVAIAGAILALLVFLLGNDQAAYYFLIIAVDPPLTFVFGVLVLTWFVTAPKEIEEGEAEWEEGNTKMVKGLGYLISTKAIDSRPELIDVTWQDNLEQAIIHFQAALQHFTRDRYPYEHAGVQSDLGKAFELRIKSSRRDNLEQAIACFREALQVFTQTDYLEEYAIVAKNLGTIYMARIEGNRRDNLEKAIAYFQASVQALQVCDQASSSKNSTRFSRMYAEVLNDLGNAYRERIEGDRSDNLEKAIACHREALQRPNPDDYHKTYACIQHDLGLAYRERLAGDRHDNLEQAIKYFNAAMQVYSFGHDTFYERAMTLRNLGTVYQVRIEGNRCENLKQALVYYTEALKIHTLEDFPIDFRDAQLYLADTLMTLAEECQNSETAQARYSEAHEAYAAAQMAQAELGWLESDEQGRAMLQGSNKLTRGMYARDAWCLVQLGELRHAVVALEAGRAQALAEAQAIAGTTLDGVCKQHAAAFVSKRLDLQVARRSGHFRALRAARDAFLQVRQDIRRCSSCPPDFLPDAPTDQDVACAAAPDQAIVYLTATDKGGLALVVPPALGHPTIDDRILLSMAATEKEGVVPIVPSTGKRGSLDNRALFAIAFPLLKLENIDDWLTRRDHDGNITGGYLIALQLRGSEVVQHWVERAETERELQWRANLPFRELADTLPPDMATLRKAIKHMITTWDAKAKSLSGGQPEQQKATHRILARLSKPTVQALFNRWVLSELNRFFQQAELEELLQEMSVSAVRSLRKALDDHGLGDPDQRIAFIPCGALGMLPIHAAWVRCNEATDEWVPFQETCELTIQASARSLEIARQALERLPVAPGPVLTIGNPELPSGMASKLSYAKAEAQAIARIAQCQGRQAEVITDEYATISYAKSKLASVRQTGAIVHFATHGYADPSNLHLCYMLLANGEQLTLMDLQRQRLLEGIRLFNASACDTAVGDFEIAPDELGNLAAGALQAGAPCAVATLWPVNDRATFLLMVYFMERLAQGNSPARALRESVRWLRTATWAQFKAFAQKWLVELELPVLDAEHARDTQHGELVAEHEVSTRGMTMEKAFMELVFEKSASDDIPYHHAIFWAATVLYGA
jgi:CHAT domain-containing protein/tetratricopeptide (TPR) repeat protein